MRLQARGTAVTETAVRRRGAGSRQEGWRHLLWRHCYNVTWTPFQPASSIRTKLKALERVKGIEPSYSAWKAAALPLSYTRAQADQLSRHAAGPNRHAPFRASSFTGGSRPCSGPGIAPESP